MGPSGHSRGDGHKHYACTAADGYFRSNTGPTTGAATNGHSKADTGPTGSTMWTTRTVTDGPFTA